MTIKQSELTKLNLAADMRADGWQFRVDYPGETGVVLTNSYGDMMLPLPKGVEPSADFIVAMYRFAQERFAVGVKCGDEAACQRIRTAIGATSLADVRKDKSS